MITSQIIWKTGNSAVVTIPEDFMTRFRLGQRVFIDVCADVQETLSKDERLARFKEDLAKAAKEGEQCQQQPEKSEKDAQELV